MNIKHLKYFTLTLAVIIADQIIKLIVYKNFHYEGDYEKVLGLDWFKIEYVTNEGMAFGAKIGGKYGKLLLTIFRLIAVTAISIYLIALSKKGSPQGLLWCIACILGGALGNVVDSIFYGEYLDLVVTDAPFTWFHGRVIDMFYFDICDCMIPNWVPVWGGSTYPLWPVFNLADASIFVGVCVILVFQKRYFKEEMDVNPNTHSDPGNTEEVQKTISQ